jgi:hypothetical protein
VSAEIRVKTDDNELTLTEMSSLLPDTSTIMSMVGHSWWHLIYAARGGNWRLAEYYMKRITKLDNALKVLRPKHKARLERFQAEAVPAVEDAIAAKDIDALEVAYAAATALANVLHAESDYPYIKWVLPDEAPRGLQLEAVEPLSDVQSSAGGNGSQA